MKLLVATEFAHDAPGGGPSVVRQMLNGFADSEKSQLFWWALRRPSPLTESSNISGSFAPPFPSKLYPTRRFTHLKANILERLWAPLAAAHLRKTIRALRPDGMWVIPHNWSIPPIAKALGAGKLPNFHTTIQDYPDVHGHYLLWGAGVCERLNRSQDNLFKRAASRDATSLPMLDDLKRRTGAQGAQMLHQGIESEDFAFLRQPKEIIRKAKVLKIVYAGSILVMREFQLLVEALGSIRSTVPLELHFYGIHSYADRPWYRKAWMVEHGNLPDRKLISELRGCDWGLVPMSLEDSDPRYNRFSFPTKFITYLAAGLPILTLGHKESSVIRMAQQYEVGVAIMDGNPRNVVAQLGALADTTAPIKYQDAIFQCAKQNFDASVIRNKLWQCLTNLPAHQSELG